MFSLKTHSAAGVYEQID